MHGIAHKFIIPVSLFCAFLSSKKKYFTNFYLSLVLVNNFQSGALFGDSSDSLNDESRNSP